MIKCMSIHFSWAVESPHSLHKKVTSFTTSSQTFETKQGFCTIFNLASTSVYIETMGKPQYLN